MLNHYRFSGITIMDLISRRRFGAFVKGKVALPAHGGMARAAVGCRTVGRVAAAQSAQDGLPRRMLEAEGASSAAVLAFLGDIEQAGLELHSFMLSRGGAVVAEGWWWPYQPPRVHMTHSLTKSVAVNGVALAMADGRLGLDDKVVSFFSGTPSRRRRI